MTGAVQNRTPWGLVTFLLLLHMLNQIDRQLVASFASDIMRDLELDRAQFALIAGLAFSSVYAAMVVAAGLLADRVGRVRVLTGGVSVWSLFTGLAGMAQGFWTMLAARPFVAAGEATLVWDRPVEPDAGRQRRYGQLDLPITRGGRCRIFRPADGLEGDPGRRSKPQFMICENPEGEWTCK